MKICKKCEAEKPLTEFYAGTRKCRECTKADVRLNRKLRADYDLEYDRTRPNSSERTQKQIVRAKQKYHSDPEYKRRVVAAKDEWQALNPLKRKAQHAANNAVRDGKLERGTSCEHCGTDEKKLQKNHWSYLEEHWLDVIWLCTKCHGAEHKRLNEIGRDPDAVLI